MKRKMICGLLAAVLAVGSLTGCGSGTTGTSGTVDTQNSTEGGAESADGSSISTKYPRNEQGYPDLGGETFTIWFSMTTANSQATSNMEDYEAIKQLEEKFNCHFEFVHPPVGQEQDNFTIMMADSTLPDMIFCGGVDSFYPGGIEMAYDDGILYDYTDYINKDNTPNFYGLIENDDFLKKAVTDDEGRIIRLGAKVCGSEEADLAFEGPLIRSDFLEAAGMEVPETIDDWTNMLKAMKENGVENPLALCADGNDLGYYFKKNIFSSAYGISAGDYYVKEDGKVAYGPYEDAYKDYLTLLNQWYEAGYINPDFSTQSSDNVMSMLSSDKVGAALTHLYSYGTTYYVTTESADETKALVPAPVPVLKEGDELAPLRTSSRGLGDYKYITADAKNPEACIALLDALYLEDIDRMLANGIEGVGYDLEDGVPVLKTIPEDASKETLLGMAPQQWHTYEDTDLDYILTRKYNKGCQDEALQLWKEQGTEETMSNFVLYSTEESEIQSSYQADVDTYVEEMVLKFIMGKEPIDNFAQFQQSLKDMHIEDLIAVEQSAKERYEAR
jgi:putative aldouronate transport system substrate-binding protein